MTKWYTYLSLKEVKEGGVGMKNFYAVVDEIVDSNIGCVHLRLWDLSRTRATVRLTGNFAKIIQKGHILRVHRFQRADQGDVLETIGFGEPGKATQVVVWRANDGGQEYVVVGSSSGDKYTRNGNDTQVIQQLHTAWLADEIGISAEGDAIGDAHNTSHDSFYDTTGSQKTHSGASREFVHGASQPLIEECSLHVNSFMAEDGFESLLDDNTLQVTMHGEDSLNVDSVQADGLLDNLLEDTPHETRAVEEMGVTEVEDEEWIDVEDSEDAGLAEVEEVDEMVEIEEEAEAIRAPLPPLPHDIEKRLQRAVPLSDLREYKYYDCRLQVVDAYVELTPAVHVVLRCFDPQSSLPTYAKPLRTHSRSGLSEDHAIILPDESVVEASRGVTVDIYCYAYDEHIGVDGKDVLSGDWLLFCNLSVGHPRHSNETVLSMDRGGEHYGRCIRLVEQGARRMQTEENSVPNSKEEIDRDERTEKEPVIEPAKEQVSKKQKQVRFETNEEKENNNSLSPRLHSFRAYKTKAEVYFPRSPDKKEKEIMIPRCKTILPFVKWRKQIVHSDVVEEPAAVAPIHLLSRVYCNCGAPLDQKDRNCFSATNKAKRHEYFYRNKIFASEMSSSLTCDSEEISIKNQILPSLACLSHNAVPTVFDLIVQVNSLSVKVGKYSTGFPPCHVSVWDGSDPPESIDGGVLIRNMTTEADKMVIETSSQLELISQRTIHVRMAKVQKFRAGEFAILRDVFVVRAGSMEGANRSLSPVWMLQARDMDVIREDPKSAEEFAAFREVAKRIFNGIINMKEAVPEKEKESTVVNRKSKIDGNSKRSKRIRLDEDAGQETWMVELAKKEQEGVQSQEPLIYTLRSTIGVVDLPGSPMISDFASPKGSKPSNSECFAHNMAYFKPSSRSMWLCWMTMCDSFNTIKERTDQVGCCPEKCGGKASLYAHISIDNPIDTTNRIHLLIDVVHFRSSDSFIPYGVWCHFNHESKLKDLETIKESIRNSSIAVHRVRMTYLKSILVFVVQADAGWITVSKR